MSDARPEDRLTVGLAQIAPVWMDRDASLDKVVAQIQAAAEAGCRLVAFGEALVPGYPFWLERSDGARFESPLQQAWYARYVDEAVCVEAGHLAGVCEAARAGRIAVVLGIIERPPSRGESLYASLVYIGADGGIGSVHRKLMPTYEERLAWSPGDGHGLRVHALGAFTVGGLNCWENWMPLARAALYGQGEDLHVAIWPGNPRNTQDITRCIAREGRSFVLSVCGLMQRTDIPDDVPEAGALRAASEPWLAAGGSCIAGPDGEWLVEPVLHAERLIVATLDHAQVRAARQSFDPAGHYARPDVLQLRVDRRRQGTVELED